jgi:hypothetical protein
MASVDVFDEMIVVGSAAGVEATAGAGAGVAPADASAGVAIALVAASAGAVVAPVAGVARAMRYTNNTSGFVLRRMATLVNDGTKPDKVFKDKDVNYVVKALREYCGEIVSPTQVYNHLRKCRQKWSFMG